MPPYSTLEVREVENHNISNDGGYKEAVISESTNLDAHHAPFEFDQRGISNPQVIYQGGDLRPNNQYSPAAVEKEVVSRTNKICGLPRRGFYIILAIVLLLIIIISGTVGGVVGNRQPPTNTSQPDDSNPNASNNNNNSSSPHTSPSPNILSTSKLTSSNRTDADGVTHRTVFFQDPHNAIVAREWDARTRTWTTNNVTDAMRNSATPLNPAPGTPLASASGVWDLVSGAETHLFFLAPDYHISSAFLYSPDTDPTGWRHDVLGDASLQARAGSQLAAMWQRCFTDECEDGTGWWVFAYQNGSSGVCVANSTDYSDIALLDVEAADYTSLAFAPQLGGGGTVGRALLAWESLSSGEMGVMQKSMYSSTGWTTHGEVSSLHPSILPPFLPPSSLTSAC